MKRPAGPPHPGHLRIVSTGDPMDHGADIPPILACRPRMSDFHYSQVHTRDAQEHGSSLSTWEQRYEQLSTGPFEASLEDLRIGPVQVFREFANRSVLQDGTPRPGTLAVGFVHAPQAECQGWCSGHRLAAGRAIAVGTNNEFELVTGAGMALLGLCVDKAELERRAARLHGPMRELDLDLSSPALLKPDKIDHDEAHALIEGAMSLAREQPVLLAEPEKRRRLAESLTDALLACFVPGHLQSELRPSAAARHRIVSRAWDYMRAHADEPITVPQLCAAAGASRRGLQYAFEEVMDLSPVSYLHVMRLNRVRAEIRSRHQDSVGDIATRWGFWHLSRFAAEYRQLFGELPSATRQRRPFSGQTRSTHNFAKSG